MKISSMLREAADDEASIPSSVKTSDHANYKELIRVLTLGRSKGRHGFQGEMLDLDEVVGYASALGRKVLYSLCRRYPHEIGRALGFNSGEYLPAQYEPSGAGPFGRGSGGKSGRYNTPMLWLKK
jgi:hypothetical protein